MATINPTSVPSKRLSETISGSASTFKVDDILGWDGVALTSSDFGGVAYAVLRNSANTLMELIEFDPTTIASTSITINKRGLKFTGDRTTEVSANKLTWIKGDTIVEFGSHVPQLFASYAAKGNTETIDGTWTYSAFPQKSGVTTPTAAAEFATKAYVDAAAAGSAVYDQNLIPGTAGETLVAGDGVYFKTSDSRWWKWDADAAATAVGVRIGVAQGSASAGAAVNVLIGGLEKNLTGLTVGPYYISGTAGAFSTTKGTFVRYVGRAVSTTRLIFDGNNDPEVLGQLGQEVYASDAVGTDAYAITLVPAITAYKDGLAVRFKAGTANTGNATLAINGLTAKNILKKYNATLDSNDIRSGQIVEVVYDGTQDAFQMMSHPASIPLAKFGGDGSDGALSISSGTTTIDLNNAVIVIKNYTSISITGTGALAFINPATKGTLIVLKSQGNVTITSSATRAIDLRSLGGAGGAGAAAQDLGGATGSDSDYYADVLVHAGAGGAATSGGAGAGGFAVAQGLGLYMSNAINVGLGATILCPGSGGGGGGAGSGGAGDGLGGAGGRGAGSLYIECAGAYSCSGTIDASGGTGTNGSNQTGGGGGGAGGGGGSGGGIVILYNTLTSDTGTYTVTGGAGGTGGTGNSNDGGDGGGGGGIHETAGTIGDANSGTTGATGGAGAAGFSVRMVNPRLV